ncbi:RNA polymerase ADP-ribosylase [Citrobacter phage Moon]|uniref:ADP-ribosylase n=1 Tax=Citrobacter phage Moon TaxID=1540095 RepID=A0A0A0YQ51_9CAUD|nr:RNA polymerase ADP-ribosylase [Citrobacter phage Moon]AIX12071.1 hypothetical protein CPT_Moon100 [Citrobacter phage Moon]
MHILMKCLGNKINDFNHKRVNDYIKDKLEIKDVLFRGLTIEEVLSYKFEVNKRIKFKRITSFSSESHIAETFAAERYMTNVLIVLKNANIFDYSTAMIEILENLIAIEESGQTDDDKLNKLYDNLSIVDYEREFLLPISSELTVKNIYFDNKKNMHIIEME